MAGGLAGASRALTLDLHAPQIQGYFDVPVDHLYGSPVLVEHFRHLNLPNLTVVSPDAGGVERARFFAKKLDAINAYSSQFAGDLKNITELYPAWGRLIDRARRRSLSA